jgi:hypothetical protein
VSTAAIDVRDGTFTSIHDVIDGGDARWSETPDTSESYGVGLRGGEIALVNDAPIAGRGDGDAAAVFRDRAGVAHLVHCPFAPREASWDGLVMDGPESGSRSYYDTPAPHREAASSSKSRRRWSRGTSVGAGA